MNICYQALFEFTLKSVLTDSNMATKMQRDFKRQMKELEKDGKLPDNYYARRKRITFTGGGVSFLFVLYVLWRFGILGMITSGIYAILPSGQREPVYQSAIGYGLEDWEFDEYTDSYVFDDDELVDDFISSVYLDIYKHFYDGKKIEKETFESYRADLPGIYESVIGMNQEFLKDLRDNDIEILDNASDMLDFAIAHYDNNLSGQDKYYLDILSKKSQDLTDKRYEIWQELAGELAGEFGYDHTR